MQKNLFKQLKALIYQNRRKYSLGFILLVISNFLLILNPMIFREAITSTESSPQLIWYWLILLISVAAASAFFKYWMRLLFIGTSRNIEKEIRSLLFDRIQSQSMAFYDRHGIGELISRLSNDVAAFRDVLGPGIMYPLMAVTTVIPGLTALYIISAPLTLASLVPFVAIPLFHRTMREPLFNTAMAFQKLLAEMSNMAQENFSSIRIIKGYTSEKSSLVHFRRLCKKMLEIGTRFAILEGLVFPMFVFISRVSNLILVVVSGVIIIKAWSVLTAADFVAFMWLETYIFFPILVIGWLLPIYERGKASYQRLYEIYTEPIEVQDRSKNNLKIPEKADLEFRNLTFTYPTGSQSVLKNVQFKIPGGTFVGITGPVGAGKSTLIKLLNREYEIPEGMIFIGGRDIHEYPLTSFHQQLVTVEQVPFLFSKSIAENVVFGRREASREEIEEASRFADIHESVLEFPQQYETMVGERGVTLSGGQKQRVAMARAFLVNRSILLLDDIFSAVDSSTEKQIFDSMVKNFAGKTVVLITHRVTILEKMDQIIYLSDGKVLETGSPEELMEKEGHYAALVELQRLVK
jgi:ATP-binding cassette subfamily B multidrug efflux pump